MSTQVKIQHSAKGAFVPLTSEQLVHLNVKIGATVHYEILDKVLILKHRHEGDPQ